MTTLANLPSIVRAIFCSMVNRFPYNFRGYPQQPRPPSTACLMDLVDIAACTRPRGRKLAPNAKLVNPKGRAKDVERQVCQVGISQKD